jgi:NitT/TauT family transport system substrate-binding protein
LREGRLVVCDPAPIPADEMQRTYDWVKSWGLPEETASPLHLVTRHMQQHARDAPA